MVRAALWGQHMEWPVDETDALLRMHAQQGTGALVYPSALAQANLSSYARAQMKSVCVHTLQQQTHLQHTLNSAWQALEQAGIRAVLLKGAGLAALYADPSLREWGDIDLFVGKEQYHPACAVMRKTFPNALRFEEELEHYKHYNLIVDGISIELHRVSVSLQHPLDEQRYARMETQGMAHTENVMVGGLQVRVPEPTFNLLFVFIHAWEHMLTKGAAVRQLCDIALMLHHYNNRINAQQFRHSLNALHLMEVWQLYAYILVHDLGLEPTEALWYSERVADRAKCLAADLLSKEEKADTKEERASSANRFVRKFYTMCTRLTEARKVKRYSIQYARHMVATTITHGTQRLFAKDRRWE